MIIACHGAAKLGGADVRERILIWFGYYKTARALSQAQGSRVSPSAMRFVG